MEEVKTSDLQDAQQPYQWPPPRDPNLSYRHKSRNPVHSIITALPIIMLVAGLSLYFYNESQQTRQSPIASESVDVSGIFTGLSHTSSRDYLWVEIDGVAKGIRVPSESVKTLESLERGSVIDVSMAPRISQSKTYWAWRISQSDEVILDAGDTLR